jgi:acetyltransferase (GNAT) family protein
VSNGYRSRGIGGHLTDELERFAREQGDTSIVLPATPSLNTVRFYRGRGFEPMSEPLPELYELESEDVHMQKRLSGQPSVTSQRRKPPCGGLRRSSVTRGYRLEPHQEDSISAVPSPAIGAAAQLD